MAVDIAFNTRIQVATFDKQTDGSYLLGEYSNQNACIHRTYE